MSTNAPKRPQNEGVNRVNMDGVNTTAGVNRGMNSVNMPPNARPVPPPPPPPPKK